MGRRMCVLNFITQYRTKKPFCCQGDPGLTRSALTPKATSSGHRGLKKSPAGAGWALAAVPRGGGKEDPPLQELSCAAPAPRETTIWSETRVFQVEVTASSCKNKTEKSFSPGKSHRNPWRPLQPFAATGFPNRKPGVSVRAPQK